jgi:hypothetical protein
MGESMRCACRFRVLLLALGLLVFALAGVRAEDDVAALIDAIDYADSTHRDMIVTLLVYRDTDLIGHYTVTVVDTRSDIIRASARFTDPQHNGSEIRLKVPVRNLPPGEYVLSVEAYDEAGELLFQNTRDFEHTLPGQLSATAPSSGADLSGAPAELPVVPLALAGAAVAAIAGGYMVWKRPASKRAAADRPRPAAHAPISTAENEPITSDTIFISYSRTEWDNYVEPLARRLEFEGLSYWLDQHLIQGGDDWMDTIGKALRNCERLILCVSPRALESRYVKMEYRYFFNQGKTIYPLVCVPADLPAELQGIQYHTWDELDELIDVLQAGD